MLAQAERQDGLDHCGGNRVLWLPEVKAVPCEKRCDQCPREGESNRALTLRFGWVLRKRSWKRPGSAPAGQGQARQPDRDADLAWVSP